MAAFLRKPRINQITPGHEKYEIRTCGAREEHTCVRAHNRRSGACVRRFNPLLLLIICVRQLCAKFNKRCTQFAAKLSDEIENNVKQCQFTCGCHFLMFGFRVTKSAGVSVLKCDGD